MKIGDKVKILEGDHEFEGRTGVICDEYEKDECCLYDYHVVVDDARSNRRIPFYATELEVIV